jgi:hypothetical protein
MEDPRLVIEQTRAWIRTIVIGLDLCPFARGPFEAERIRYTVSGAHTPEGLLDAFVEELRTLCDADPARVETSFLIHPYALTDFYAYNDFLDVVDEAIRDAGMEGIVQVVGFHPHYRFAGTHPEAVENHTNRSPYPMLHLLRESSVARAVAAYPDTDRIPRRNIRTLRALGWARLKAMLTPPPLSP